MVPQPSTKAAVTREPSWSSDRDERQRQLLEREWLVALGNGGYASGSVGGVPRRRHHGMLIAGLPAPLGRTLTLSHLREEIESADGTTARLWGEHLVGQEPVLHGAEWFEQFSLRDGLPYWRYRAGDALLQKRITPVFRKNMVVVHYELLTRDAAATLSLRPLVQFRGHDAAVSTPVDGGIWKRDGDGSVEISASNAATPLRMKLAGQELQFLDDPCELESCFYPIEHRRGYDHVGPLWSPGCLRAALSVERPVTLVVSTDTWEEIGALDVDALAEAERARRGELLGASGNPTQPLQQELVLAADQFLIRPAPRLADPEQGARGGGHEDRRSVIAGYPWFTDWGRDTMISLPGLTLATGRHDEARRILLTFADYVRDGLIPNLFPEGHDVGMYHTADATLWFFQAVAAYHAASGDEEILARLYPTFTEIVGAHLAGTHYGIGVDAEDGLLRQGAPDVQLTWMDAKVEDWVVTPRRGKAVEINALWFNALRHYSTWLQRLGHEQQAAEATRWADRAGESFNRRFWYAEGGYLYDVIDGESGDDALLRPNQLFAISLPHPVLDRARWQAVIEKVTDELFTPVGLRSLAPSGADYQGLYDGDLRTRDGAYHQGTVWAWLLGPYLEACEKADAEPAAARRAILNAMDAHLSEACIGQVSEIFDGDQPHTPRGCFAQAWSVAELLRTWRDSR